MNARPSRWLRRAAIALAIIAGLLAAVFFFVPNALLRSDFVRSRVNRHPDRGWLEYDIARSSWPGSLKVTRLRYRDRDPKAEWAFELDEAELTYSVAGLLRRSFHVTRLTGRGLSFRVRQRLTEARATRARLARLPPIPGFPEPPLLAPPKPKPPPTGREWTVRVDGLAIEELRELWIDEYRYVGDGRVTGGFFLLPKQEAEVFDTKLASRNGTLRSGKDVLAEDVRLAISTRIPKWNPRAHPGSRMLRFVSGQAEATARLEDADVVNHLLGRPAAMRLERGSGRMSVRGSVDRGVASSEVRYASSDVALRAFEVAMRGRLEARVALSRVNIRTWGGGRLDGGHVRLTNARAFERDGATYPWWARIDFGPGAFRPRTAALFTTDVDARARDSRPLLQIVSVDLPEWLQRLLRLDEELRARASVRIGRSLAEIRRLAAQSGRLRIFGDYSVKSAAAGTFLFDAGPLSIGVAVAGKDADVRVFTPRKWFRERTGWEPPK